VTIRWIGILLESVPMSVVIIECIEYLRVLKELIVYVDEETIVLS